MNTTTTTTLTPSLDLPRTAPAAARAVFQLLKRLHIGTLDVQLPDGSQARFGSGSAPRAAIRLHGWDVCGATLKSGDVGFAESFIAESWTTPDLVALLSLFVANRESLESAIYGTWWGSLLHRIKHRLQRNSRNGSRRNIHAHYDLGNRFYRLWLDETMNYSSAWFDSDLARSTPDAQRAKVRRALVECGVRPGQRLLEIGCGWGALAECAAREFDAQVTGVTLSTEQLTYGQQRLRDAGLAERAELRLQDYRDIADAPFDAVVSIEMFEAVGSEYWPAFFDALHGKLVPGGRACVQSIVIRDDLFDRYARSTDFIQQYIFPGGMLPSAAMFREQATRAGFEVINELAFGGDYAETLRRWRVDFLANEARVLHLGFDGRFMRIWDFYLAYCEAAFANGNTDVIQFTLRRR